MPEKAAMIWCPFPDSDSAAEAANVLLDDGLIACANLIDGMRSFFVWRGEKGDSRECGALFKTRADLLDSAIARLEEIHPYDSPAIAGWRCDGAGERTLSWLADLPRPR